MFWDNHGASEYVSFTGRDDSGAIRDALRVIFEYIRRKAVIQNVTIARLRLELAARGNERLRHARRAILCEGQDDVEALMALTKRMGVDLWRRNIAIVDCGGRETSPLRSGSARNSA